MIALNKTSRGNRFLRNLIKLKKALKRTLTILIVLSVYINNSCIKNRPDIPDVTTGEATFVKAGAVTLNAIINPKGYITTVSFEYGTNTSYGNSIGDPLGPYPGVSDISVSADVEGLTPFTTYHFRVKAVNAQGTSYGEDKIFEVNCMSCRTVTYQDDIIISEAAESSFCGAELQAIISMSPLFIGDMMVKWVCR